MSITDRLAGALAAVERTIPPGTLANGGELLSHRVRELLVEYEATTLPKSDDLIRRGEVNAVVLEYHNGALSVIGEKINAIPAFPTNTQEGAR